jgi:TolB-like protein/DNA-binding winged helix-turn-helix (wHTH) protein/Tfp pilus assembly protein PilF
VRFADFELDLRTGELRRDGASLRLQPQPAKVLVLLVSKAGEVVTRQDLAQQIWASDTFVDFEHGLNYAVGQIRATLGDNPDHPIFLETLPKRGYRFIAPLQREPSPAVVVTESAPIKPPIETDSKKVAPRRRVLPVTVSIAIVLLIVWTARYFAHTPPTQQSAHAPIRSIAVLPLANLSANPAQEYFTDGLTDELITELAKIGTLRVISRTSVVGYKSTHKRAPEIARELQVDAIVEGTVERIGDHARIRAQLIQAANDQHLWAESYDRDVSDLLRLERDVARDIAQQIGYRVTDHRDQLATQTVTASAHEDYLRGRYYWNTRTDAGLRKGIEYFEKAIEREPNYAMAYAGLADSYIMLANWGFTQPSVAYPKAKAAARKALELDAQLAEAHASLAYVTLLYDWDWATAENGFRTALRLNPNYASAHHFYSICLMTSGRYVEALEEIKQAQELDPLSLIVNDVLGWIHYEGREYPQAIEQYNKTLEIDPRFAAALLDLGTTYMRQGDYRKALAEFEKAKAVTGDNGVVLSNLAQAHAQSGDRATALRILGRLEKRSSAGFVSAWDLSLVYLALGNKKQALALLDKAADGHVGWVVRLGVDPAFDSLRTEPAFQQLVRRVRIPQRS